MCKTVSKLKFTTRRPTHIRSSPLSSLKDRAATYFAFKQILTIDTEMDWQIKTSVKKTTIG